MTPDTTTLEPRSACAHPVLDAITAYSLAGLCLLTLGLAVANVAVLGLQAWAFWPAC